MDLTSMFLGRFVQQTKRLIVTPKKDRKSSIYHYVSRSSYLFLHVFWGLLQIKNEYVSWFLPARNLPKSPDIRQGKWGNWWLHRFPKCWYLGKLLYFTNLNSQIIVRPFWENSPQSNHHLWWGCDVRSWWYLPRLIFLGPYGKYLGCESIDTIRISPGEKLEKSGEIRRLSGLSHEYALWFHYIPVLLFLSQ